jgi:hypothetical protein
MLRIDGFIHHVFRDNKQKSSKKSTKSLDATELAVHEFFLVSKKQASKQKKKKKKKKKRNETKSHSFVHLLLFKFESKTDIRFD